MITMPWRLFPAAIALLITGPAAAQTTRPPSQDIGTWVLTCPPGDKAQPCTLRHRSWVFPPGNGTPGAALEVVHRGGQFVPVVALRGLSTQVALGGMLALQATVALRFDNAPQVELPCGLDGGAIVCTPAGDAAKDAAAELPTSRSVLVRVRLGLPGGMTLPEQSRSLDLQDTPEALAQFRATAPANESVPVIAGLDWRGFLDRLARDAGFRNGLADLMPNAANMMTGRGL